MHKRKIGVTWGSDNRAVCAVTSPKDARRKCVGRDTSPDSPDGTATRGTINNCGSGRTPWGNYLTCEENWAGYFVNRDAERPREQARYGVPTVNSDYRWDSAEPRFDASSKAADALGDDRNAPNTFGWMVEIDPADAKSTPIKRTALGRFGHEGAIFPPARIGHHVVVYSGDDAINEHIYKFVSNSVYTLTPLLRPTNGDRVLDEGTLFVNIQHPAGESHWPDGGTAWPRSATVIVTKDDGGIIGT